MLSFFPSIELRLWGKKKESSGLRPSSFYRETFLVQEAFVGRDFLSFRSKDLPTIWLELFSHCRYTYALLEKKPFPDILQDVSPTVVIVSLSTILLWYTIAWIHLLASVKLHFISRLTDRSTTSSAVDWWLEQIGLIWTLVANVSETGQIRLQERERIYWPKGFQKRTPIRHVERRNVHEKKKKGWVWENRVNVAFNKDFLHVHPAL